MAGANASMPASAPSAAAPVTPLGVLPSERFRVVVRVRPSLTLNTEQDRWKLLAEESSSQVHYPVGEVRGVESHRGSRRAPHTCMRAPMSALLRNVRTWLATSIPTSSTSVIGPTGMPYLRGNSGGELTMQVVMMIE